MRIVRYLSEHKLALLAVFVLLIGQAACDLALPTFTADIVDTCVMAARLAVEAGGGLPDEQMAQLAQIGLQMLGVVALGTVFSVLVGLVASRTGASIGRDLRERLFTRVMQFSEGDIGKFSAASLITRGTNDIQLVQMMSIMGMRMVLYAPILAVGGIVMVMTTNASMGWVIAVAVVAVFVVVGVLFKVAMPKFRIMQKLIDRVNLVAREMLTGLPVVRAFGREDVEEARFDTASANLRKTQLFTNRAMAFMMPAMMLVMNATSVAIVWVGGHYIDTGAIQTGDLIAFITYSMTIIMSFLMIGMIAIMLPRADVAAARIDEVLACEPSIKDPQGADGVEGAQGDSHPDRRARAVPLPSTGKSAAEHGKSAAGPAQDDSPVDRRARTLSSLSTAEGSQVAETAAAGDVASAPRPAGARIEFDDVSFRYDETSECVLEHVSFTAEPGCTLAIIGATGSGKSTVLKLIERFYDVSSGAVRIDGVDVRDLPQKQLRANLGYVPQKAFLFAGTVESNVAYADLGMPDERVERALSVAQAADFVDAREGGVESVVSQGGTNVSGGQRQRLAIARALASNARAFLFDDSFSALDYKTDAVLREQLEQQLGGVTRVIVAQRISTIMDADRIVVLDEGCVAGQGTHEELMRTCEEYREIALSQLSEEELATGGEAA
ncbi:MAG: ABC transporter ATP-binding protein [Eggerthellaceae bacterium]|nr:ABC transporter ATP-binding protein [Eggerthellaceae bacterium]